MKKRLFSLFLSSILFLTMFSGCTSHSDSSENTHTSKASHKTNVSNENTAKLTHVTLNEVAHSIFYAPMYIAIENGYFLDEDIELELVCGFGADKVMTAVLSGEADIGFMGSESSIYTYVEGANDYVVNFAQLTQRAGNFLVSRENISDFTWEDLKGSYVLGGRKGVASIVM